MRVIKDKKVIADDWRLIREIDDAAPAPEGKVVLPFHYWKEHSEELLRTNTGQAIWIDGDTETELLVNDLARLDLIALDFTTFMDGRSYSHARLLRERYHYRGELRAIGNVLRDQLFFMQRCGFDSFQVSTDKDAEAALKGLDNFSVRYQAAADDAPPTYKLR